MIKDKAYRYTYMVKQSGPVRTELFGRDTRLSNDELELMRRDVNQQTPGKCYIQILALLATVDGMGTRIIATSAKSRLPPQPLFQLID
jgi:hypothetical protein